MVLVLEQNDRKICDLIMAEFPAGQGMVETCTNYLLMKGINFGNKLIPWNERHFFYKIVYFALKSTII